MTAQRIASTIRQRCQGLKRGVDRTGGEEVKKMVAELRLLTGGNDGGVGAMKRNNEDCSATWKLLWTTEKETLFILEKIRSAGEVYQVLDVERGVLNNVIQFEQKEEKAITAEFVVDSTIAAEGNSLINFEFTGARLQLGSLRVPLPPYGKGWFDNVYVDDQIRIAIDSRGDTLVCAKADIPWTPLG